MRIVENGAVQGTFVELDGLLIDGEQGLLGMALHPDFDANGRFYLYYTPARPRRNVVAEFQRSTSNPRVADPTPVATLVEINDSESNHNGGMIAFGPDGHLYVGMGDEGGGGDDHGAIGNALDRTNLFGAMLRLDVDAPERNYAAANPFDDGEPQIWAYGLRNPWRWSFDRQTGDLYIADVGQNQFEEINVVPAGTGAGANFGWRAYEGLNVFDSDTLSLVPEHFEPAVVYRQDDFNVPINGCSVTGGYVYRGSVIGELDGWYLYGDFCNLNIGAFRYCDNEVRDHQRVDDLRGGSDGRGNGIASFGEDGNGEMYMLFLESGHVRRIVPGG